jgi:hypothetical protein
MRLLFLLVTIAAATACGAHGKMRVDTPVIEYRAPDISEITGIDEPDAAEGEAGSAAEK